MAKQIKLDREFRFIRFVNRHILPRGWNICRWHNPNNKKPFPLAGVYVRFGWGMTTQVPAFYKDGEFYSVNNGERVSVTAWRYAV